MEGMKTANWAANGLNFLLGAAGTAMGATALGVKANASHFNRCGENWGSYNNCGWGNGFGYGYGFNGCCGANTVVNRFELEQSQRISELESDRATDNKLISLYSQTVAENKDIRSTMAANNETIYKELVASRERQQAEICRLDKEAALNKQAMEYNFAITNGRIDSLTGRLNAITKEIVPIGAICPQPLPACAQVALEPQTIPTTAAGAQGVIIANKAATAAANK